MHIQTVTFTMPLTNKEVFETKMAADANSAFEYGCIGQETWINETKKEVAFTIVSKWDNKKDFQQWLGREEHLASHRMRHVYDKEHPTKDQPKITKKMKSFTLYKQYNI